MIRISQNWALKLSILLVVSVTATSAVADPIFTVQVARLSGAPAGGTSAELAFLDILRDAATPGVQYDLVGPEAGPWTLMQRRNAVRFGEERTVPRVILT